MMYKTRLCSIIIAFNIVTSIVPLYSQIASESIARVSSLQDIDTDLFEPDSSPFDSSLFEFDMLDFQEAPPQVKASPQDIITLLEALGGIALIMEPFFLHTNLINKRSLLDNPFFLPYNKRPTKGWTLKLDAFYIHTNRSHLTKECDHLCSYLALEEETLLGKLETTLDLFKAFNPAFEFDIRLVFSLFANMTVEDRNSGFMIEAMHNWKNSFFRILVPWYYLERNFFLTKAEKEKVEEEFGATTPQEQEEFQKEHLVSDKFGLGDTRLEYAGRIYKNYAASVYLGVQGTVPTAFKWFNGPKGSTFARPNCFPTLDTDIIFNLIADNSPTNQQLFFDLITSLGLGALDRVAANLLDTPLGNGGHFGIGIFEENHLFLDKLFKKADWAQNIIINSRISLEYLFPAHEKRFFINSVDEAAFAARDFNDESQATDNLNFLIRELIARYYLRAYSCRIQPGVIFRWTSQASCQKKRWGWHIGSDFWLQSHEKIKSINASPTTLSELDIQKAKGFLAYQSSLFGGIVYRVQRCCRKWFLSLDGQTTYWNIGIGAPWGINFSVKTYF